MPAPRRRPVPPPTPPTRRPRVAGLRHPETQPQHDAQPRPEVDRQPAEQRPVRGSLTGAPPAAPRRRRPVEDPNETTAVLDTPIRPDGDSPDQAGVATPSPRPRRPRPPRERRAEAGYAVPPTSPEDSEAEEPARPAGLRVPIALGVAAVLLGGFAVWAGLEWGSLEGTARANTALTDNAATSEVVGQVTSAVNTTFSYNYTNVGKTEKAAQSLLTGAALCQYNALFKTIQQQAPAQKLVLTTTVTNSGVQVLQGGTARVLLVLDQRDTRVATNQPVGSQAVLTVNAVQQGGKWKISNIDTGVAPASTPGC